MILKTKKLSKLLRIGPSLMGKNHHPQLKEKNQPKSPFGIFNFDKLVAGLDLN